MKRTGLGSYLGGCFDTLTQEKCGNCPGKHLGLAKTLCLKVPPTHPTIEQVNIFYVRNIIQPLLPDNRIYGELVHGATILLTTLITIGYDAAKVLVFHIFGLLI